MAQKILLQSVLYPSQKNELLKKDILIHGNIFEKICDSATIFDKENARIVNCEGLAILPPFYNGHTHAAMSLLRGLADDMELSKWLNDYIWPFETKMNANDIEIGSRLAMLEMIKSGTVFFADMYWFRESTMKVAEEMGLRACIGITFAETLMNEASIRENMRFLREHYGETERVKLAVMPHSVYTNGERILKETIELAQEENFPLHIHLCETEKEVLDCKKQFGLEPLELLEKWGGLNENLICAHGVHFSDLQIKKLAQAHAKVILNPSSNLKLSSGIPPIYKLQKNSVNIGLGTDGASSNNNLDMREEMKLLALLAKIQGGADFLTAEDALKIASKNTAAIYGINAGEIAEGKLADALLINLNHEKMVPNHHLISNWVYAADTSIIQSVICNGKFIMENRKIDGEEDIKKEAALCAQRLREK